MSYRQERVCFTCVKKYNKILSPLKHPVHSKIGGWVKPVPVSHIVNVLHGNRVVGFDGDIIECL